MAENAKSPVEDGSPDSPQGKMQEMDIAHQENAVGYREYLQAMDLEVYDQE
ncbi:MFS transporter, partial [Colletotrichum musicola]